MGFPTIVRICVYEYSLSELLTNLDAVGSVRYQGVPQGRHWDRKEFEVLEKKVTEAVVAGASPVIQSTEVIEEPATKNQARAEDTLADCGSFR